MQFSEQWLRAWVNPPVSSEALAEGLTLAGFEVDTIQPVFSGSLDKIVIGQVKAVNSHPNADKLKICDVDVNQDQVLQIVCGAHNVREGLKVVVALVGAQLSEGVRIKKAKLRGVLSMGMICSERELGISDEHAGIMELDSAAPIGMPFSALYHLDDTIIDIELTPNRGDCASIRGIAREVAAIYRLPFREDAQFNATFKETIEDTRDIRIHQAALCSEYRGRVIRGIDANAKTPVWLSERLRRGGIRPHQLIVDVMNYVMLELGQPLHAFDLESIASTGLDVRLSTVGESIKLIDGQTIRLNDSTLVIADQNKLCAIAGVMGSHDSAVKPETDAIFLESAHFLPESIHRAAQRYHLQSEAAYRFERGVDQALPQLALARATALLLEIAGGQAGPMVAHSTVSDLKAEPVAKKSIYLRRELIQQRLGIALSDKIIEEIFKFLNIAVVADAKGFRLIPPSFRFDLNQEMDFVEEVARIYGYDKIPSVALPGSINTQQAMSVDIKNESLRSLLKARSYHEVVTYSFVDDEVQQALIPNIEPISLLNPMTTNMKVMRTSLWTGLLTTLQYNLHRQADRVRLFEIGLCFSGGNVETCAQTRQLAGVIFGPAHALQWGKEKRTVDFFDIKGDVEALLDVACGHDYQFVPLPDHKTLNPAQSSAVYIKNQYIGIVGALHPTHVMAWKFEQTPYLFEFDLNALASHIVRRTFQPISNQPLVRRDISFLVNKTCQVGQIVKEIQKKSGHLLSSIEIFDIYEGQGIEPEEKSVALGLTFQDASRTLIDEEVNSEVEQIISFIEHCFQAKRRI